VAAQQFPAAPGLEVEGYIPALLAMLEIPGVQIAIGTGRWQPQMRVGEPRNSRRDMERACDVASSQRPWRLHHDFSEARRLPAGFMVLLLGGCPLSTCNCECERGSVEWEACVKQTGYRGRRGISVRAADFQIQFRTAGNSEEHQIER